jgi:hypothetical protein
MTNEDCPWAFPILGLIVVGLFIFAMVNLYIEERKK